jgi:hypothetical protein
LFDAPTWFQAGTKIKYILCENVTKSYKILTIN